MAKDERDEDGFPICNEDSVMSTYRDEYGVVYVCELVDGLGYTWRGMGPPAEQPPVEPPAGQR